ncbi:unnamed protein product [Polarella glacialis]|uniref:Uncharacterized protein n=1 Tax=Polarella glacialis TaxID=89957 RepID=A0A813FPQ1_POLGL|nr:unnamed protein product [Polarella glacialis]
MTSSARFRPPRTLEEAGPAPPSAGSVGTTDSRSSWSLRASQRSPLCSTGRELLGARGAERSSEERSAARLLPDGKGALSSSGRPPTFLASTLPSSLLSGRLRGKIAGTAPGRQTPPTPPTSIPASATTSSASSSSSASPPADSFASSAREGGRIDGRASAPGPSGLGPRLPQQPPPSEGRGAFLSSPGSRRTKSSASSAPRNAEDGGLPAQRGEDGTPRPDEVLRRRAQSLPRHHSVVSSTALERLAVLERDVQHLENRVKDLSLASQTEAAPGPLKTELALLEAKANLLECKGIDNIYTGELNSGKAEAKEVKKALLERLEKLFNLVEEVFARLKAS